VGWALFILAATAFFGTLVYLNAAAERSRRRARGRIVHRTLVGDRPPVGRVP
jgi:hypothetical protein